MKTMYDTAAYEEILGRLEKLSAASQPQWGRMNAAQMVAHCCETLKVVTDKVQLKRRLLGRVLGPIFRAQYVGDAPLRKNSPTNPFFIITDERTFQQEKERYVALLTEFHTGGAAKCTRQPHSFFGDLTPEEWGRTTYKHLDHHLQQFGV